MIMAVLATIVLCAFPRQKPCRKTRQKSHLMHVHDGADAQRIPEILDDTVIVCQIGCIIDIRGCLVGLPNKQQPAQEQ